MPQMPVKKRNYIYINLFYYFYNISSLPKLMIDKRKRIMIYIEYFR